MSIQSLSRSRQDVDREAIAQQVEAFLKNGGKIDTLDAPCFVAHRDVAAGDDMESRDLPSWDSLD